MKCIKGSIFAKKLTTIWLQDKGGRVRRRSGEGVTVEIMSFSALTQYYYETIDLMLKKLKLLILTLTFLLLFSCSKNNFPLASQEVHKKALQPPPAGMAKVYCFGSGFAGGIPKRHTNIDVKLNSKTWGQVYNKNYLYANLRPGKYYITGPSTIRVDPYVLNVEPNRTYFIDSKVHIIKFIFFELDESTGRKYIYENPPSAINALSGS